MCHLGGTGVTRDNRCIGEVSAQYIEELDWMLDR